MVEEMDPFGSNPDVKQMGDSGSGKPDPSKLKEYPYNLLYAQHMMSMAQVQFHFKTVIFIFRNLDFYSCNLIV